MKGTLEQRFWAKVKKTPHCWWWIGAKNDKGYGQIGFHKKLIPVHRYSYILHKGIIPKKLLVCHTCDIPYCVNPKHLWLGTPKQNSEDMVLKNRSYNKFGENNPNAKLTQLKADKIKRMYKTGNYKIYILGQMFGVNRNVISRIVTGKQW